MSVPVLLTVAAALAAAVVLLRLAADRLAAAGRVPGLGGAPTAPTGALREATEGLSRSVDDRHRR